MTPSSDLQHRTQARQQQTQQRTDRTVELIAKITAQRDGISQALAGRIGPERFLRAVATLVRTTPKLAECSVDSILGGLYVAAQLGLEVGGPRGLVYLVPYGKEAALVVGYRGWVDLIYRAGARSVQWFLVREGDLWQKGSDSERGPWYRWVPLNDDESRPYVRAVAQVQTGNGGTVWVDMTREQITKRSTGSPIWRQWPEEMALKTVLRAIPKLLQTSTEHLALATSADETVQRRIEVPGLPAEQHTEHLPVLQHPQPQPGDARSPRPRTKPLDTEQYPARTLDDVDEPEPDPLPEPPDDWEARERADADAYLAEHEDEGDR